MPALRRLLDAESDRDFGDALGDLHSALGPKYSWGDFARDMTAARPDGGKWTASYLNQVARGKVTLVKPESMAALAEAAAKVARIKPTYFREYREHLAARRAAKLARTIGLDEVLAVLDELEKRG